MLLDYIRNIILFPGGTSDLVVSISLFILLLVWSMAGVVLLISCSCQESRGAEGWRRDSPRKGGRHKRRHHTALEVLLVHLDTEIDTCNVHICVYMYLDSEGISLNRSHTPISSRAEIVAL